MLNTNSPSSQYTRKKQHKKKRQSLENLRARGKNKLPMVRHLGGVRSENFANGKTISLQGRMKTEKNKEVLHSGFDRWYKRI